MGNKEVLQGMKSKLEAYTSSLGELDAQTIENLIKEYVKKLDAILDYNGIRMDIDLFIEEMKYEAEEISEVWRRTDKREDEQRQLSSYIDNRTTDFEQISEVDERNSVVTKAAEEVFLYMDEEKVKSGARMDNCLEEILENAQKKTMQQLVASGYYDLEDFEYELIESTRKLAINGSVEYRRELKKLNTSISEQLEEVLSTREESVDFAEKLGINPGDVLDRYEKGDISDGITLAPGALDISVMMVKEPLYAFSDEPIQKGICISQSILDKALEDGNNNLFDLDASPSKYELVEKESYIMVLTAEENEKVNQYNRERTNALRTNFEDPPKKETKSKSHHSLADNFDEIL